MTSSHILSVFPRMMVMAMVTVIAIVMVMVIILVIDKPALQTQIFCRVPD
jgi:hypothetical protein